MKYHRKSPVREKMLKTDSDSRFYVIHENVSYAVDFSIVDVRGKKYFWAVRGDVLEPLEANRKQILRDKCVEIVRNSDFVGALTQIIILSKSTRKRDFNATFPSIYLKWHLLDDNLEILTSESAVNIINFLGERII